MTNEPEPPCAELAAQIIRLIMQSGAHPARALGASSVVAAFFLSLCGPITRRALAQQLALEKLLEQAEACAAKVRERLPDIGRAS